MQILDNALKRSLTEVEKAHKYGVEKIASRTSSSH
jgi:molecular chaperone GrpE (heat shock protein)